MVMLMILKTNMTNSSMYEYLNNDSRDDAIWIITSSFIIFTMQSGFGLLESGTVSGKNEVNIMVKNVIDVVFGGFIFWAVGYGITFGDKEGWANEFIGIGKFFHDADVDASLENIGSEYANFFFQLSFSTTASTIVSGAMVERTRLPSYIVTSMYTILVHSFVAHWVWAPIGFLHAWPVIDVAGAGPVHLVGGSVGAVSTLILGPRLGRFAEDGQVEVSSPTNALLGTFMLWWGWLGFNCGSTWGITQNRWHMAARSAVATIMSSIGGGIMAIIISYAWTRKCKIDYVINGILASLVSITALCAFARPIYSVVIGMVGSGLAVCSAPLLEVLKVDDPVGVIPVHLVGGLWSLLSVGLFAEPDRLRRSNMTEEEIGDHLGLFFGGGPGLLGRQSVAVLIIVAWSVGLTAPFLLLLARSPLGLRVSAEEEQLGADFVEHDLTAQSSHGYGVSTQRSQTAASICAAALKTREMGLRWRQKVKEKRQSLGQRKASVSGLQRFAGRPKTTNPAH